MASTKSTPSNGSSKPVRNGAKATGPALEHNGTATEQARAVIKISTVSHTLESAIAEQLRHFAFRERISESAVIEYALRNFLSSGVETELGQRLREAGAALRRKS